MATRKSGVAKVAVQQTGVKQAAVQKAAVKVKSLRAGPTSAVLSVEAQAVNTATDGAAPATTERAKPKVAPNRVPDTVLCTPLHWDEACAHLSKHDRVMKKLIPRFGQARLNSRGDAFTTLARSIVGQQISVKAAQSVWDRLLAALQVETAQAIAPDLLLNHSVEVLRGVGLSGRKVEYLKDLATHFNGGLVDAGRWASMDDEAVINELVAIRGIGRWTVEMFLIFHLMRPNVLPLDDLGLLKGISQNYFSGESVSRAEAREIGLGWAPFRSVATWYIWRSLDPLPVEY
jgi:DNA-3-methyladenine glycosylase II